MKRHALFILVADTGVGKGKLMDEMFRRFGPGLGHYQSVTTRPRRDSEAPTAYEFIGEPEYVARITSGELIEHARPFEHDPIKPSQYGYGRTAAFLTKLDEHPLLCDMTEPGVQAFLKRSVESGDFVVRVIRIEGRSMAPLARRDERAATDAARRVQYPIRVDHILVNDHADGGFDSAADTLEAYIRANALVIAA